MRYTLLTTVITSLSFFYSCASSEAEQQADPVLSETWLSPRDTVDNVDSPAVWHGPAGQHWVLATAKNTDVILVYDASRGEELERFGGTGTGTGRLERPNGISVVGDLAIVVERDNHRIQVFELPSFNSLGFFGEEELELPYGITSWRSDGEVQLYVTDNYETADEQVPPDNELGRRVHHFVFNVEDGTVNASHIKAFGDTEGPGVLRTVETIYADTLYDRLFLAEEDSLQANVKIYNLAGEFTGTIIGDDIFKYEPEGIALYTCDDGQGYWIVTDQDDFDNRFYLFERESLEPIGAFSGEVTRNTDGVALSQTGFGPFEQGAFFAVHNDGSVVAISWADISMALGLELNCTM